MGIRKRLVGTITALLVLCGLALSQYSWVNADDSIALAHQTFAIENMTCAACPITVKKAMSRIEGVSGIKVDFKAKTATVEFNPSLTTSKVIAKASTDVGFPATPIKEK